MPPLSTGQFNEQCVADKTASRFSLHGTTSSGLTVPRSMGTTTPVGAKETTSTPQPVGDRRASQPFDQEHIEKITQGTVSNVAPPNTTAFGSAPGDRWHRLDQFYGNQLRRRQLGSIAKGAQPSITPIQNAANNYQASRPQFTSGTGQ